MASKHTPGPWKVGSRYKSIVADAPTGWDDADNLHAYGGHMVCESVGTEANARLIAMAPRMYEVLRLLSRLQTVTAMVKAQAILNELEQDQ